MIPSTPDTTFAEATALKPVSAHEYEAIFRDDWCIGSVPHGGYVTGIFLQVASKHFSTTLSSQNQPHTIAIHLDFLRRTSAGPALFTVRDTKLGRQASVIHVTLSQGGREEVVGSITQGNIPAEEGVNYHTNYALNPAPLPVDLSRLANDQDKNWKRVEKLPFSAFRRATNKVIFHYPRDGQRKRSSADEWVKLATGEKWTNASLGFIADMWPMPVEAFASGEENVYDAATKAKKQEMRPARFWYPTLLLNIDVKKALPDEGCDWLFVRVDTKLIKNGRMDLEVVILDETGDIVALSHHIAFALPVERNLAVRRTGESKM